MLPKDVNPPLLGSVGIRDDSGGGLVSRTARSRKVSNSEAYQMGTKSSPSLPSTEEPLLEGRAWGGDVAVVGA